jgi:glycosyltransferase involved in cell wall biosynthesis
MGTGPLVAIFCNSFPPEGGGASGRIYNLAVLLQNAGYRVHVVCAMPNYPRGKIFDSYRGKLVVNELVDGIAVRRVWLYPSNVASASVRGVSMMSFVFSLKLFAFGHIRQLQPALVIVSSPPLLMASACMTYFRKHRFKVLLNVSDIWPLSATALGAITQSTLYRKLVKRERQMYESATAITAQSNETLEHIAHHSKGVSPVMLYRNLPDYISPNSARQLNADKLRIIYPGLLGHAQGLLELCKAIDFGALRAELHIYGEGAELEALISYSNTHPERGIYLHKPVKAAELAAILATFNTVLVPLITPIKGALPSKLFTAALAGIPVLYSGGGEGEHLVASHKLGFAAAPGDYAAIATQIRALASMPIQEQLDWRADIATTAKTIFSKDKQDAAFLEFVAGLIHAG